MKIILKILDIFDWRQILKGLLWFYAIFLCGFLLVFFVGLVSANILVQLFQMDVSKEVVDGITGLLNITIHVLAFIKVCFLLRQHKFINAILIAFIIWTIGAIDFFLGLERMQDIALDFVIVFGTLFFANIFVRYHLNKDVGHDLQKY